MAKAMIRQKEGIVRPQIVAGREFKGTSFTSKPDVILYKVSVSQYISNNVFHYILMFLNFF